MITLAFAQMIYYVAMGLERYGGDDGLTIRQRSQFGGLIDLNNKTLFYYPCLALLVGSIYLISRLVNSRFGLVIPGGRSNDRRMRAIGFPTFRYKLPASSLPARCADWPARSLPTTPTSSVRPRCSGPDRAISWSWWC